MWAIKPNRISPAGHDREAVGDFAIAAAELDVSRTSSALFRGDIVQGVSIQFVLLEIAIAIVKADRPEAVDRNIADMRRVDNLSIVLGRREIEVDGILARIAAPGRGR